MHTQQKLVLWQLLVQIKLLFILTQDEGEDIILTGFDWADLGNANTYKLLATGMDSRLFDANGDELLSGSSVNVFDKLFDNSGGEFSWLC